MAREIAFSNGGFTIVDDADYERVSQFRWSHNSCGYAQAWINGRVVKLHRLLMSPPPGLEVDHLNNVRHDNRRENLDMVTKSENCRRMQLRAGVRGATWVEKRKKWQAQIRVGSRNVFLGYFNTEAEAHAAFEAARIKRGQVSYSV